MAEEFFYKRAVNKAVLYNGFGIGREYMSISRRKIVPLKKGGAQGITLLLNGREYAAELRNLDDPYGGGKKDAYQVCYAPDGEFAKALQSVFFRTVQFLEKEKSVRYADPRRQFTKIPDELKEYLVLYTTDDPTVFSCETIVLDELRELKKLLSGKDERILEAVFSCDGQNDFTGIGDNPSAAAMKKLDRSISDALKEHYRYRCQICGYHIGVKYDSHLVEAHHIRPFVSSLDNDISNIIILCPNHHGIIHDKAPVFRRADCSFEYSNGYVETLRLNDHLHI